MRFRSPGFHSALGKDLQQLLDEKRALGRRYLTEERALHLLDDFFLSRNISDCKQVTSQLLDAFLQSRSFRRPRSYNTLLSQVRQICEWWVRQGLLLSSPLCTPPRRQTQHRIPFLFDALQARRLLDVAAEFGDQNKAPLRGKTYHCIFALLFGLGLRVGEACRLLRGDVDLEQKLLLIRGTKFGKSRLVPFGPKMAKLLDAYLELREKTALKAAPLFSFTGGHSVHPGTVSQTFHHLVPLLGLCIPEGVASPRLHDLRHSFAVGTLLRWYRSGLDPAARLFHLSTFLGHVNPTSTAVYLTITQALLSEASRRFETLATPLFDKEAP